MKLIKGLQHRIANFVQKRGGTFPKIFVWIYAAAFLACGFITIFGIIYEFILKNVVNYKAVNDFIGTYFTPSIFGTFTLVGVLLIDKDNDGIPDRWQQEEDKDAKRDPSKQIRP